MNIIIYDFQVPNIMNNTNNLTFYILKIISNITLNYSNKECINFISSNIFINIFILNI